MEGETVLAFPSSALLAEKLVSLSDLNAVCINVCFFSVEMKCDECSLSILSFFKICFC